MPFFMMAGCVSEEQQEPGSQSRRRFGYDEKIENILFSPKAGKLIVLGERYHYLFDDMHALGKALNASFKKEFTGSFGNFTVNPDNRITGSYRIRTGGTLAPQQREEALRLGLIESGDGGFELRAHITGERFESVALANEATTRTLNKPYVVAVDVVGVARKIDKEGALDTAKRASGVVLMLLAAPYIVLFLIFNPPCLVCGNGA